MPDSPENQTLLYDFITRLEAKRDTGEISGHDMRIQLNEALKALADGDPKFFELVRGA